MLVWFCLCDIFCSVRSQSTLPVRPVPSRPVADKTAIADKTDWETIIPDGMLLQEFLEMDSAGWACWYRTCSTTTPIQSTSPMTRDSEDSKSNNWTCVWTLLFLCPDKKLPLLHLFTQHTTLHTTTHKKGRTSWEEIHNSPKKRKTKDRWKITTRFVKTDGKTHLHFFLIDTVFMHMRALWQLH